MAELHCKDCSFFYCDYGILPGGDGDHGPLNEVPYCHWEAKAPDDLAPCEEE